jgi:hypothetical protein
MRARVGATMIVPTMLHPNHPIETAAQALNRLRDLRFELAIAEPAGLQDDASYMDDIREDIAASEQLYVGLAVTEIASLRAELGTPLLG